MNELVSVFIRVRIFILREKPCFDDKIGMICFRFYSRVQVDARLWI